MQNLIDRLLDQDTPIGCVGIGHTRWATHGVPSNLNSHPHTNNKNTISLVHNGIIENYRELKEQLVAKGYKFHSETDSEVVVHLLDSYYDGDMLKALKKVITHIDGSYALCIVSTLEPDVVYVTKKDSPLVLGTSDCASFGESDIPALLRLHEDVYFIDDFEIAKLCKNKITFYDAEGNEIQKEITHIPYDNEAVKGRLRYFHVKRNSRTAICY